MPNLTVNVPDEIYNELTEVAKNLKESPENCLTLALNHFMQTDTIDNAIEGISRIDDGQNLVDIPALEEEIDVAMQFHPEAVRELEALDEDEQIVVLEELISRLSEEDDEMPTVDLILRDNEEGQLIVSSFDFGDIVYLNGETIILYHFAMNLEDAEDEEEEDFDDEEEMDSEEDDLLFDELEEDADEEYRM